MAIVPPAARLCGIALAVLAGWAAADDGLAVEMKAVSEKGTGASLGRVEVRETEHGVVFEPDLSGLPPGLHGFHVHERPDCGAARKDGRMTAAAAAGGHYDPDGSDAHGTPWGDGHLGDLPALYVDAEGNARHPVLAPRLELADLEGRAL
jgi:Cu-Zn family superoxide dismutase